MQFTIKGRFSLAPLITVEIEADGRTSERVKLGLAISQAVAGGAYLSGADLTGADLTGAYLRGAYLRGAYLRGAYLRGAYLTGADLTGAYLRGADLTGADLRGAYLGGADLTGADLRGAYLGGATSKVKKLVARVTRDDGYEFFGFILEDNTPWIAAGCQSRSLASYRKHVTEYNDPAKEAETNAILDYIEKRMEAHTCAAG